MNKPSRCFGLLQMWGFYGGKRMVMQDFFTAFGLVFRAYARLALARYNFQNVILKITLCF